MYTNVFCFCLSFSVVLCLLVCQFLSLVASFDGLRPLLVTSHCSLRSLADKLRTFWNLSFLCQPDCNLRDGAAALVTIAPLNGS